MKKSQNKLADAEILRQKAEKHLREHQSKASSLSSENDLRKLAYELQVHQIELEMQYESLKQAKEKADYDSQKYTELYDFAPSGYITLTKLGEIIELNFYAARLLGKERLRLINRRLSSSISEQSKPIFNHFLDKVFKSEGHESCEVTLWVESMNIKTYVYLTGHVIENGEQCRISVVDITKRKQAEEALHQSYEFSESLLKSIPIRMDIVDENGTILYQNEQSKKIFGESKIGEKCWILYKDDKKQCSDCPLVIGITLGQTETCESAGVLGNRIFDISHTGILYQGKKAMLEIFQDITERKEFEANLIIAKERAEESDRLKLAFLANMSHEIRTPMNGILGFAELLKEPGLTGETQQEYINIIEKAGARMLNIINDIVDISKIEAGLMNVNIKETDINEKIEFVYIFFKPQVEEKGMQFFFKNTLSAKEATIRTDNEKFYSILTNLVKNAIKYSQEGTIEFGYLKKGETLEFYVKDTGIGIPKERQTAIFERFIQADITDKMALQGAGLGLSIAKAYVEMLGGKIWVESEEGIGSTFYFTLPYQTEQKDKKAVEAIVLEQEENLPFEKLRILIVEDDKTSEMLISIMVNKYSKEVLKAGTGNEAIEICLAKPDLDLILMDILMPEMDGYEATRQIRQFNKDIVIIAQTAYGFSGEREKAIKAGCDDFISKPIKKDELLSLIQKYFKK
jgi:PAS domain S-box-containing protein